MGNHILVFAPGADRGGIATALCNLIDLLVDNGCAVKVLVPYEKDVENAAIPKRYIAGYCRKRPIRFKIIQRIVNLFSLLTAYRFYFIGVKKIPHDICIVYSAPSNAQWARYTNKPLIGWFHGIAWQTNKKADITWHEKKHTELMARLYGRFDWLVAVSSAVADSWAIRYKIDKPDVIPNLIRVDHILSQSTAPHNTSLSGKKKLLFVGRMTYDKGLDRLVSVLGRLKISGMKDWHLTIVGDGPERSANEEVAGELGLTSDVKFVGMVENPYPYMKQSDLLICPSRSEGLGLVLWESLICRTAVLATDSGGTRSALHNGEWGCLVPNEDDAIYSGLLKWLNGADYAPSCGFDNVEKTLKEMNGAIEGQIISHMLK